PTAPPAPILPAVPSFPPFSAGPAAPPNAGDLAGVAQQPFVGLALADALAMALQRNTDLAVAQSNRRIAAYHIIAAQGAYDTRFQLVPSYQHSSSPAVSPFQAGPLGGPVVQDTAGVVTGVTGRTPSGGTFGVNAVASEVSSNSTVNGYNPFYNTALQFTLTQPLARGRAIDDPRRSLQLAQINAAVNAGSALALASNVVVQTSNAYYDLVAAWQNVGIQEEGLRQASAQAQSNARLAARGALAPTDIVEANAQVAVFQDNVFAAIQNVGRLQTSLKSLILANPADPVWFANLVPTSAVLPVPAEPALDALVVAAIAHRPEVAQIRGARASADVNVVYARDQLRPQFDLGLGYTTNGFAGNPTDPNANPIFGLFGAQVAAIDALIARSNASNPGQPPIQPLPAFSAAGPPYQTGGLGTSFRNLLQNRYPAYSAQLTYAIPLGNRTARANLAIAQEQQRQVQVQEAALLQRFRMEAANAIQGLREARSRVAAARAGREAAERVLLGEQRRFAAGTSTTFLVLQRQLDVANQRGREVQAQTDLDKAIVELNRVSGEIFTANNIDATSLGAGTLNGSTSSTLLPPAAPSASAAPLPLPSARPTR
ncbi:MAG: TolC family protein, partial [Candidatus Eremiobacteraeota bacterium]|nr:TolC family protein [Candidatus Eremiobacteraeota bacterium]